MTDNELMRSAQEAIDLLTGSRKKLYDFVDGELETKDQSITMAQLIQQIGDDLERGEYIVDRIQIEHPEEMENRSGAFFDKVFRIYSLCDEIFAFLFRDELAED